MAYVQLSLLHIPAVVIHGNTLALEERSHWLTPAHIMGGWEWKLAAADRRAAEPIVPVPPAQPKTEVQHPAPPVVAVHHQPRQTADQLSLF